jgi:hypothetical protein
MMVPTKVVVVPRVAEVPTCQKTLQGLASPVRCMVAPDPVTRVVPVLKMKTPLPLRVRVPEIVGDVV